MFENRIFVVGAKKRETSGKRLRKRSRWGWTRGCEGEGSVLSVEQRTAVNPRRLRAPRNRVSRASSATMHSLQMHAYGHSRFCVHTRVHASSIPGARWTGSIKKPSTCGSTNPLLDDMLITLVFFFSNAGVTKLMRYDGELCQIIRGFGCVRWKFSGIFRG